MSSIAGEWNERAGRSPVLGFTDASLRGASQVMLQNNPLTGLLFIVGIVWAAVDESMPSIAIGAVTALAVSTAAAVWLDVDVSSLRMGLFGFNGILVGTAVPTFLGSTAWSWVYVVFGAAVSTVIMLAVSNVAAAWDVPALTFPFVLTTWLLMLSAYAFASFDVSSIAPPEVPAETTQAAAEVSVSASFVVETLFRNVAQVFLIDNVATGVIFVVGLFAASLWAGALAVAGAAIGLAMSLALHASASSLEAGLYGFNAVLTAIALGCTFYRPGVRVLVYTIAGAVFAVIVQGALDTALAPFGLPTLTAPFVFATWLFLLPKVRLARAGRGQSKAA